MTLNFEEDREEAKPIWPDISESDSSPKYELDTEGRKSLRTIDSLQKGSGKKRQIEFLLLFSCAAG